MSRFKIKPDLIIGYILMVPAIIGEISFSIELNFHTNQLLSKRANFIWLGNFVDAGGGYNSPLPIYFGLMAIAGAYLIKSRKAD